MQKKKTFKIFAGIFSYTKNYDYAIYVKLSKTNMDIKEQKGKLDISKNGNI